MPDRAARESSRRPTPGRDTGATAEAHNGGKPIGREVVRVDRAEYDALARRVAHAEDLGRAAIAGWVLTVLVVGLWIISAQGPLARRAEERADVLRARAVHVVDNDGVPRAILDAVDRRPALWMYDAVHRRRLGLAVRSDGTPGVVLNDEHGLARLGLSVGADGTPIVGLADSAGRPRIELWVNTSREPVIALYDSMARHRIILKVLDDGIGRAWLLDGSGQQVFSAP